MPFNHSLQYVVANKADHIAQLFSLAILIQSWYRKPRVAPYDDLSVGKRRLELPNYPLWNGNNSITDMPNTCTQYCRDHLPGVGIIDQQRMIHILIIVAVKEGELLVP